MNRDYRYYRNIVKDIPKPLAFVDLDVIDENVRDILKRAGRMRIRIASKSVRCTALLKRFFRASSQFQGVMCYTGAEAVYLSEQGLDDLLVAYPIWDQGQIEAVCNAIEKGKLIYLMIDSVDHVRRLSEIAARATVELPLCIDLDMSSSYPGIHFGVRRSSCTTAELTRTLGDAVKNASHVRLAGLMGYEAQIAGLPDRHPVRNFAMNAVIRLLKKRSLKELRKRRGDAVALLQADGHKLDFVNGGGTGSVESTISEEWITEVTVGSGFYSPTLFDYYDNFRHLPAAGYAVEITRQPTPDIYTCHGGGFIASGPAGMDKVPKPYLPEGAALLPDEGAGEVQTPILYTGPEKLGPGEPVFLRHGKAGEICEHFNELLLISNGRISERVKTYRGEGHCFL